MALSVHDELIQYAPGSALGSGASATNWAVVPGCSAPTVRAGGLNHMTPSVMSPDGQSAVYWKADTFSSDQAAIISHDPTFYTASAAGMATRTVGASVRQDPLSASCYVAIASYFRDPGGSIDFDGVSYGNLVLDVYRVNAGVWTALARVTPPGWTYADDWWFGELQVWGQSPVNLRVVFRAPAEYVPASTNHTASGVGQLPAACDYIIGGSTLNSEAWRNGYTSTECNSFTVSTDAPKATTDVDAFTAGRAWTVWEGQDTSGSRLLSGQPGFRWGGNNYFDAAKFSARELTDRLTARVVSKAGSSATIGGYRKAGSTVTATGGGTWSVSYPDATTWAASASDVVDGATVAIGASTGETADLALAASATATAPAAASPVTGIAPSAAVSSATSAGRTAPVAASPVTPVTPSAAATQGVVSASATAPLAASPLTPIAPTAMVPGAGIVLVMADGPALIHFVGATAPSLALWMFDPALTQPTPATLKGSDP